MNKQLAICASLLSVFTILLVAQNSAPVVENVRFEQRTDGSFKVDIYYDLDDAEGDEMTVSVEVSDNAGQTYSFTTTLITGDIGEGITSGTGKHIVWDFGSEHPDYFSDQIKIKIIADDNYSVSNLPSIPILSSPPNNAVDVSISPILNWNSSNAAISYTLQVSASNSFNSYVYNQAGLTNTNQQINGLVNSTTYYWRVNAMNDFGTLDWSSVWNFTTEQSGGGMGEPCPGIPTVTYAGKTYNTVQIGDQCWLKENLNVGTMIESNSLGFQQTDNGIIEKYCYDNDPANCETYGGLYEWPEAMQYSTTEGVKGICLDGWHIPTLAEFETLIAEVNNDGNALKAVGQGTGSGTGTNESGFSVLLSGYRNSNQGFVNLGYSTNFWSSTDYYNNTVHYMYLNLLNDEVDLYNYNKEHGFSVRCVKD